MMIKQIKQEFNFKFKLIHVKLIKRRDYWLLLYIGYCEAFYGFMGLFDNSVPTKYESYLDEGMFVFLIPTCTGAVSNALLPYITDVFLHVSVWQQRTPPFT